MIHAHTFPTPLGFVTGFAKDNEITAIKVTTTANKRVQKLKTPPPECLLQLEHQLQEYFVGKRNQFNLPVDLSGHSAFSTAVWHALLDIPYGKTVTYTQISEKIGRSKAVRAVSTAIGKNPFCILIPCHRVINKSGALGGYAYGLDMKRFLLALEAKNAT